MLVYNDTEKDPDRLAERLREAEAVILTQARSPFPRAVIERLPKLKLISQTGRSTGHIDIDACTEHGVVVSAAGIGHRASDRGAYLGSYSRRAATHPI